MVLEFFAGTYVISENVLRINNTLITLIMQSGASAELASNMSMTLLYFYFRVLH